MLRMHAARLLIIWPMRAEIEDFILYLATERGLSDNYQISTRLSLEGFALWLERRKIVAAVGEDALKKMTDGDEPLPEVEVKVGAVTRAEISDYLAHKKRLGLSAASIKLVVVAIKIFFRWLAARGRIAADPADVLPLPRTERYLPETMNELQVDRLIEGIDVNAPRGLRDRAIVELLYASGLRVSELVNAKLEHLDLDARFIRVTGKGKSHSRRTAPGTSGASGSRLRMTLETPMSSFAATAPITILLTVRIRRSWPRPEP